MSNYRNTVFTWFRHYLKPNEAQFTSVWNWLRWKDEKIPVSDIDGLDELILQQADDEAFQSHVNDTDVHMNLQEKQKLANLPKQLIGSSSDLDSDMLDGLYPVADYPVGSRYFDIGAEWKGEWVRISETEWRELPYTIKGHGHSILHIIGLSEELDKKVEKVPGKGLSSNDFTDTEKQKLAGLRHLENDPIFDTNHLTTYNSAKA